MHAIDKSETVVIGPKDEVLCVCQGPDHGAVANRICRLLDEDDERLRVLELTRLQDDGCRHADLELVDPDEPTTIGPAGATADLRDVPLPLVHSDFTFDIKRREYLYEIFQAPMNVMVCPADPDYTAPTKKADPKTE